MKLNISPALLGEIEQHARRALPNEACGLLVGRMDGGSAFVASIHPSENMAAGCGAFEIDPALHISLQRNLRGDSEAIIGVYHSHPEGPAEPSARDISAARAAAYGGWIWLITALPSAEETAVTRAFHHIPGAAESAIIFADVVMEGTG